MSAVRTLVRLLAPMLAALLSSLAPFSSAYADRASAAAARVLPEITKELAEKGLAPGAPVYIRIFKETSELEIWMRDAQKRYVHFRTYPVCYFSGNLGPKTRKGDGQAPEGFYTVRRGQLNPASDYHLAFNVGYPNSFDRAHGRTGSAIMVHGNCVSIGCFAMTNSRIEEIYTLVERSLRSPEATVPVHIFPFKMTPDNMSRFASSPWIDFWRELEPAFSQFETTKKVPVTSVSGKKYVVAR